ncbi:SLBB domain-containing protein [bacterium]|nr:SLBB domain-containing protein [bacterium]
MNSSPSTMRLAKSAFRTSGYVILLLLVTTFFACSTANHYIVPTTSEPLGAQELAQAQAEKMEIPPLPGDTGPYRIGGADVLQVRDLNHPDLFVGERRAETLGMNLFTVQDDGLLALPLIGLIEAAGKTPHDLLLDLNEAYRVYVREPNISVTVYKYNSRKVYVLGQVSIPGAYPFDGRMTVLDAIGQANGLNEKADLAGSYMIRGVDLLPVNLYALLRKGDLRQNISLADGDMIHIADLSDRRVYVLGEVVKPGVFPMGAEPLRLIDAISMAGGLNPVTAKKGNILLVRGGYADPTVYKLDLSDVMSLTSAETILKPGDRVYATATGLTNWNRIMVQLLPFLQGGESATQMYIDLK